MKGCLCANLVCSSDVNTHYGMFKLEVGHSRVKHLLEVGLRSQHVFQELSHPPHYWITMQPEDKILFQTIGRAKVSLPCYPINKISRDSRRKVRWSGTDTVNYWQLHNLSVC